MITHLCVDRLKVTVAGQGFERKNLTEKQKQTLAWLTRPSMRLATDRAHRWREDFQDFYAKDFDKAEDDLRS